MKEVNLSAIQSVRAANLVRWVDKNGIPKSEKSLFSQYITKARGIGENAARRLESDYGMGHMYLDGLEGVFIDDKNTVAIPQFELNLSAGSGMAGNDWPECRMTVPYQLDYLRSLGAIGTNCARFVVCGDSMEPLLYGGDKVLVDLDQVEISQGKVYALRNGNELLVKRCLLNTDKSITLISENQAYQPARVSGEQLRSSYSVIGRVIERVSSAFL